MQITLNGHPESTPDGSTVSDLLARLDLQPVRVAVEIELDEALALVLGCVTAGPTQEVPLADALFRTLARSVCTDVDDPPFDRSVMDGFAVRAADVVSAPVTLRIVGAVPAGTVWTGRLGAGETVQINTGAPIPGGADAVVRVEETEVDAGGRNVLVRSVVAAGKFITRRAAHVTAGDTVLTDGTTLTPGAIGVAGAAGATRLLVHRRPRVALVATGNELVDVGDIPQGGQIRNSNQSQLAALVRSAGADPVGLGVARDDPDDLAAKIRAGLEADALCLTGGISMGAFDFVPEALLSCGVTFRFRKVAIKPGRPIIFGTTPSGTLVFALPGNPVSAMVGFELCVRPALAAWRGQRDVEPRWMRATLRGSVRATAARRTFLPGVAGVDDSGSWCVEPTKWFGSGDVFGLGRANALIMRPPHAPAVESGGDVKALLLPSG